MSLLILNKTQCPICNTPIKEGDNYYMFPPFVANNLDPLKYFSDNSFHLACLEKAELGKAAIKIC